MGAPEGWGLEWWRPEGWGAHNFALLLPSSLWGSSHGILVWCFGRSGPQMCLLNPGGLWGVHTTRQPENSKRAHFRTPALQTPPKFHEKTPREGEKERKWEWEKKKREIGLTTLQGLPPFGAPTNLWSQNSTSKNWPKSKKKLAEVEIGRSRSRS